MRFSIPRTWYIKKSPPAGTHLFLLAADSSQLPSVSLFTSHFSLLTTHYPPLNVRERIIRIHGASANLVEQYMAPGLSQKVMLRNVAHARYENGRWMVDMLTYNVIPKNEDFAKIERAL